MLESLIKKIGLKVPTINPDFTKIDFLLTPTFYLTCPSCDLYMVTWWQMIINRNCLLGSREGEL